jgi:hypothetical protein
MTPRFRRVAVFVGTAALAAGTGIGVAASSGDGSTTDRPSSAPGMSQPQDRGGPAAGGGLSDVAEQLGVSETRLAQAMRNARPTDPSAGGDPDAMIEAVAEELGLEVDQVREAFESSLGTGPPQGQAPDSSGGTPAPPTDGDTTTS